jgi:hypothetical protein
MTKHSDATLARSTTTLIAIGRIHSKVRNCVARRVRFRAVGSTHPARSIRSMDSAAFWICREPELNLDGQILNTIVVGVLMGVSRQCEGNRFLCFMHLRSIWNPARGAIHRRP